MNSREKLDEYAKLKGLDTNQLLGWSVAADFADWYAEQEWHDLIKRCEKLDKPH